MTDKVFKYFVSSLEQASYYYGIHKNKDWKRMRDKASDNLIELFNVQQSEIERLKEEVRRYKSEVIQTKKYVEECSYIDHDKAQEVISLEDLDEILLHIEPIVSIEE